VLGKTLGVPLFQEQAMRVAMVAARFTAEEADRLRKAMATFKFTQGIAQYREQLVGGMVRRGYDPEWPSGCSGSWRASAVTAFPRATPPASPTSPMSRPG